MTRPSIELSAERGRVRLRLVCVLLGEDLCVTLSGGDREHIGAVALSHPGGATEVLAVPRHREADLARKMAARLGAATGTTVCVACGIHVERILSGELADVLDLADELTEQLIQQIA